MKCYEDAYYALTGLRVSIHYNKGWYWVHGKALHRQDLDLATERLLAKLHVKESEESYEPA